MSFFKIIHFVIMAVLSKEGLNMVASDQASGFKDHTIQHVNGSALFFEQFNLTYVQNDEKGKITVLIGQSSDMNDSYTYAYIRLERCNGKNTDMALSCVISVDGIAVSFFLPASKIREISNILKDCYIQLELKYLDKVVYSLPVHIGPEAHSDEERAILMLRSDYDNDDKRNTKDIVVTKENVYFVTKFLDEKALQDKDGSVRVLTKNTTMKSFQLFKYLRLKDCKERKNLEDFTCSKRAFGIIADLFFPKSLFNETLFVRFEVRYWNNFMQKYVSIHTDFLVIAMPLLLNGFAGKNKMLPEAERKLRLCCQNPTECQAVILTKSGLVNSSSTCTTYVSMLQSESTYVTSTGAFTLMAPDSTWRVGIVFPLFLLLLVAATVLYLLTVAVKRRRRQWENDNVAHV